MYINSVMLLYLSRRNREFESVQVLRQDVMGVGGLIKIMLTKCHTLEFNERAQKDNMLLKILILIRCKNQGQI